MLIEMMEAIRAQEDAEFAQMIGLFTQQPGTKSDAQRLSRTRQKWFKRKARIAKMPFSVPVKREERQKMDLSTMTKDEKREYLDWLNAQGIQT